MLCNVPTLSHMDSCCWDVMYMGMDLRDVWTFGESEVVVSGNLLGIYREETK